MFRSTRPPNNDGAEHPITIVIVDPHPPIHYMVQQCLQNEHDIEVVGEAETGKDALTLTHTLRPDVLMLEQRLPDTSALCVFAQLQSAAPSILVRVLVYTGYECPQLAQMLLHAGIPGFLSKAEQHTSIAPAVRQVARGQRYLSPRVTNNLAMPPMGRGTVHSFGESLCERNFEVIQLLAGGMSNCEIATQLNMGKRTVREHVEKICRVLNLEDAHQVIAWAAANGFGRPKTN